MKQSRRIVVLQICRKIQRVLNKLDLFAMLLVREMVRELRVILKINIVAVDLFRIEI